MLKLFALFSEADEADDMVDDADDIGGETFLFLTPLSSTLLIFLFKPFESLFAAETALLFNKTDGTTKLLLACLLFKPWLDDCDEVDEDDEDEDDEHRDDGDELMLLALNKLNEFKFFM
jgi:hypothetical protein